VSVVSQCSLIAWLTGIASEDQRRLTGSGSALEACSRRCSIQMTAFTLLYFPLIPLSMNKHRHSPTSRITMVKAIVIRDGYGKVKVTLLYFPLIPISMNKHRHSPTSRITMVKAIVIRDGYCKVKVTLLYFPLIPISMNKHRHAPTSRLLRS